MFGLYDKEGILRFTCTDKEACIAYAKLFNLSSIEFSLMPLLESNMFTKTGSKNRVALLNWAMDHGKICRDGFNCCSLPDDETSS